MRAMAHPLRLELMELLWLHGPMTATEASERVDESPANCSFHLRTLAKYGFVEEVPGGRGRQRYWRSVEQDTEIRSEELDAEATGAARTLVGVLRDRMYAQLRQWDAVRRRFPKPWRAASFERHDRLLLTAEELAQVSKEIDAILRPFAGRTGGQATVPDGALPVAVVAFGFPLSPKPEH